VDNELNKIDAESSAKSAVAQEKKSSKPAVCDTVETEGFCEHYHSGHFY